MVEEYNPFQSPEYLAPAATPSYLVPQSLHRRQGMPFESGRARAVLAMLGVGIVGLLDIACILLYLRQYDVLDQIGHGVRFNHAKLVADDQQLMTCEYIKIGLFFITAVLFCMWFHRAYRNLYSLGASVLSGSPAWAVGSFFVPIVNLFVPCTMMAEIWRYSDPSQSGAIRKTTSPLVGFWWGAYLLRSVAFIVGRLFVTDNSRRPTIDHLQQITVWAIAAYVIEFVAAILVLLLIYWIDKNQQATHDLIVEREQQAPPTVADEFLTL